MNQVVVTTPEELAQLVDRRVEATILRILPDAIRRATEPEHQGREEAAEFLGISIRSLDHRIKNRTLPSIKRGRRVLIPTKALREYVAEARIEAKQKAGTRS